MAGKTKEDPIEKLGRMIDEKIDAAFAGRDQREKEAKDPWARLEGMIDRAVAKRFDLFAQGLDDEGGEDKDDDKDDKDDKGGGQIIPGLF